MFWFRLRTSPSFADGISNGGALPCATYTALLPKSNLRHGLVKLIPGALTPLLTVALAETGVNVEPVFVGVMV